MARLVPYFDLMGEMRTAFDHRLRSTRQVSRRGIGTATSALQTAVPTLRKRLRGFGAPGLKVLFATLNARRSPDKGHRG